MHLEESAQQLPEQTGAPDNSIPAQAVTARSGPRAWVSAIFHQDGSNLLKAGFEPSARWAHLLAALAALTSDVLKPVVAHCTLWLTVVALVGLATTRLAIAVHKVSAELGSAILTFCLVIAVISGALVGLQRLSEDENGALAALVPGVELLQTRLGIVEAKIAAVKQDTEALRKGQAQEAARLEAAHSEAKAAHSEEMAGLKRLERLQIDAAGGGAPTVQAIVEIRDMLRPGNPEIDNIPAEKLPGLVRRIIDDLKKPAVRAADFSGAVKRALTEAQADAANLKFADAARVLDAALAQTEAQDQDRARGKAALLAERGRIAGLQLHYRDAAAFYAKASDVTAFDVAASRNYRLDAAASLYAEGDEFGDNPALSEAIAAYRSFLAATPRDRVPLDWAVAHFNLGTALLKLGERESGTARLEEAIAAYDEAIEEWTRERVPLDWAMTQNNLGNALERLGERESGTAHLEAAVVAYRAALEERTREQVPLDWAQTQNNLGLALWGLGERESGTARLEQAVAAYRAALQEYTRERVPLQWAATQNNLGVALWTLGERESGTAGLEEAVAAYNEALKERTRERVPLDWAQTQNNLGLALETLGERESGTARLEQAVTAHNEALKERTRARVPLDWAMTQNNLANALRALGERERSTARLEQAAAAYRAALEEQTRERVPLDWAMTQNNLGNAFLRLGERGGGTARLERAVTAYDEALKEYTRERAPLQWAATKNNLGLALETLGERESGTARLEQAVAAYDEALKDRTHDRVRLDWAESTGNQGVALMLLAERLGDPAKAGKAVEQIEIAFVTMRDGANAPAASYFQAQLPRARALLARLRRQGSAGPTGKQGAASAQRHP